MSRTAWRRIGQLAILAAVLWLVSVKLGGRWGDVRRSMQAAHPSWSLIAVSASAVLAVYTVQIHAWRTLVSAWGARLPFWKAARVWSVSNLSRYAPASVFVTTGVMAALGSRAGVPGAAAAGSAILGTLLNVGTGAVIVVAFGGGLLHHLLPALPQSTGVALAAIGGASLLVTPFLIAPGLRVASRLVRRPIEVPPLPFGIAATAVTANVAAWFLYGASFLALARAFFPGAGGGWVAATAVFTSAYVAGWLAFLVPGGYGVREAFLTAGASATGMLGTTDALVVVVASRVLITILEVLPGATFLAWDALRRTPSEPDGPR